MFSVFSLGKQLREKFIVYNKKVDDKKIFESKKTLIDAANVKFIVGLLPVVAL